MKTKMVDDDSSRSRFPGDRLFGMVLKTGIFDANKLFWP